MNWTPYDDDGDHKDIKVSRVYLVSIFEGGYDVGIFDGQNWRNNSMTAIFGVTHYAEITKPSH